MNNENNEQSLKDAIYNKVSLELRWGCFKQKKNVIMELIQDETDIENENDNSVLTNLMDAKARLNRILELTIIYRLLDELHYLQATRNEEICKG